MSFLAHQLTHTGGMAPGQPQIAYGIVSLRQPAPAAFSDPVHVVLPDFSTDHAFKIDGWPVIHGGTMPAQGADVLVIIDDRHNKRVVWWEGGYSNPPDPDPV